jgi:hypothetical protein
VVPRSGTDRNLQPSGWRGRQWETLVRELDANGDGRISPEEFTAIVLDPQRFDATVDEFADALAVMGDPDGDGFVERPHFIAAEGLASLGVVHKCKPWCPARASWRCGGSVSQRAGEDLPRQE